MGTVSNVLNRPGSVAVDTRRRVLEAIEELGFVRNESARALRAGSSRTIGLVVLDVGNPFFTDIARGAEAIADEFGSVVQLCNSDQDSGRERRHLDMLEQQRVQGVLLSPIDSTVTGWSGLLRRGIPVVLVDRVAGGGSLCSVAVDDVLGGRLAAEHLLEKGHRQIAFAGGPRTISQVADRRRGAAEAVQGRAQLVDVRTPNLTVDGGRPAGSELAAMPAAQRPTAVFCANDLIALGVLQTLTQHGLRVPEDTAIVGYDDIEYAAAAAIPLSSISQPRDQLGRTAARLLLDELAEGQAPSIVRSCSSLR